MMDKVHMVESINIVMMQKKFGDWKVASRIFRMDKVVGKVDNVHLAYHWTWWTICLWWTICT